MRGFGLPACGRGVVVPTSMKPKPSAASASTCAPFLSSPAASPTGFSKRRPNTSTGSGFGRAARNGENPVRYAVSIDASARSCARSASRQNRNGRASAYIRRQLVPDMRKEREPAEKQEDEPDDRDEEREMHPAEDQTGERHAVAVD